MIFAPKGIGNTSVVDPDVLSKDFIEADRITTSQTQYQWAEDSVLGLDKLALGAAVKIETVSQAGLLRGSASSGALNHRWSAALGARGQDPALTASADPNLFHIPYNRGMHLIKGGTDMSITWTAEYPELILAFFSFQYSRKGRDEFSLNPDDDLAFIRTKIQMYLDGAAIYGSGINNLTESDSYRGTGYVNRNLRTTLRGVTLVGAGSHTLEAKAGQESCSLVDTDTGAEANIGYFDNPPDIGVCIAHRTLNVIRFPKGTFLGG